MLLNPLENLSRPALLALSLWAGSGWQSVWGGRSPRTLPLTYLAERWQTECLEGEAPDCEEHSLGFALSELTHLNLVTLIETPPLRPDEYRLTTNGLRYANLIEQQYEIPSRPPVPLAKYRTPPYKPTTL